MQSSGLLWKYKVNRPLTDDEREHQLKQKEQLDVEPIDQLSVIKANNTYLEVVDKYYAMKGWFTLTGIVGLSFFSWAWLYVVISDIVRASTNWDAGQYIWTFFISLISILAIFACVYQILLKESFTYTHYPVRFNRKTRMVHIFMTDGRQLSVPWDDIFFYLAAGEKGEKGWRDLRGHILDKDGKTVVDTFAMMLSQPGKDAIDIMTRQWEFIRRYMEEDHVAMINKIQNCMPIDGKYETWETAWERLLAESSGAEVPLGLKLIAIPLACIQLPFRMLAMHSSDLPLWNKEIEAANVIEADDPYIKDSRINSEGLR